MTWLFLALLSAAAAAATAILAKMEVEGVPSSTATAFRSVIVAVLAWVFVVSLGEHRAHGQISRRSLAFLALSGPRSVVAGLLPRPPDGAGHLGSADR